MTPLPRATLRLFVASAALSLVPVVLLGLAMGASYRGEARRRGVAEGRSEAQLIAQTAIEPDLHPTPLGPGRLRSGQVFDDLNRVAHSAVGDHHVLRLRIRDLAGTVVYSDDGSGFSAKPEDEAIDAAHGEIVADLTRLNSDANDSGNVGPAAVEVYQPLVAGHPEQRVGVLEIYLPYAPIEADVASGLHRLLLDLAIGLAALYLVLFLISLSVSRGLRRQVAVNAFVADHDPLTQLANRRMFHRSIAEALDRAKGKHPIAIAIVDLDRFKDVNDSLGHLSGDAVLVDLARRLEAELPPTDTLARLGGDEFGILVEDPSDIETHLGRVRDAIGREIEVSDLPVSVEASIGYVVADGADGDVGELLRRADVALYIAKEQHAGAVRYEEADDFYDPANLVLIAELRRAIDAGELVLHYQPKAQFANGSFDSVEALVRWNHPVRGLLHPDVFLPLIEPTDLIDPLTDWVLTRALTDIRDLHSLRPIAVAVNVSARNFSRDDFPDRVLRAIQEVGVAPERLTIEITETALLADPVRAALALSQLDAFGVRISLDDFGTGQTSLRYLTSLPIDELKIDMTFVSDMLENPSHEAIVRAIVDLGRNLGLRVVAEGIETREVFRALQQAGCDVGQGYLLSRPMPVGDLPRFLGAVAGITLAPSGNRGPIRA